MTDTLPYFAYGSNMLTRRLARRVPSARPVAPARLAGYRLSFHKRGLDGSGKATITATGRPGDRVHGVLFHLAAAERPTLDRIEGGYEPRTVRVVVGNGRPGAPHSPGTSAMTYVGGDEHLDPALLPFPWYRDFVLAGAREHGLPATWLRRLESVGATADPDAGRARDNRAILAAP